MSTAVLGLTRALVSRAEVVWLGEESLAPAGVVETLRVPHPYPVLDTVVGRKLVEHSGVDVVHFTGNTGWLTRGRLPAVLTIHDLIYLNRARRGRSHRQWVGHAYLRFNVPRASSAAHRLAVPSAATARDITRRFSAALHPEVIPWGVDVPSHKWTPSDTDPYVVAFSAPDPRKGLGVLIDAWRDMPTDGPDLRLLAGGGLPPGGARELRTHVAGHRVRVLDYLPRDELWDVIGGAVGLVHPATADGFAFPILEAMAIGVPVIGGLSDAARELGGEALLQVDPTDAGASVRHWARRLVHEPGFRADAAARARRRARMFSWDVAAERYLSLYEASAAEGT